ncbi:hypothetical protein RI367_008241 [Sorochytrium milnesiophthora]
MLRNLDWDDLLAYNTLKTVRVRDRRLGLLYYSLILAIIVYVIYNIIVRQLFLTKEPITGGSVRSTVQLPQTFKTPSYCPVPYPCLYLSPTQLVPVQEDGTVFVTSRVTITNATSVAADCNVSTPSRPECIPQFPTTNSATYYAAGIEDYSIMLEHTVKGWKLSTSTRNGELKGELLNSKDVPTRKYLPYGSSSSDISAAKKDGTSDVVVRAIDMPGDVMTVSDILAAADVVDQHGRPTLDVDSKSPGAKPGEQIRSSGLQIIVFITYENRLMKPSELKYTYKASRINGSESKILQDFNIAGNNGGNILQEWNRHGVQIKFVQTGTLGQFELLNVLSNVAGAFALTGTATIIVELLMLRLLPQRHIYQKYKYQVTDDFTDLRKRGRSASMTRRTSDAHQSNSSDMRQVELQMEEEEEEQQQQQHR